MAYVKSRTTSSGSVSTALVEAYRDEQGRPRQRVLANLLGQPDVLSALAKVSAQRERLRKEQVPLAQEVAQANQFYETITANAMAGLRYSAEDRKEIDRLLRVRKRLLKRAAAIETTLTTIQKAGAVLRHYCTASEAEVQEAIREYKEELGQAQSLETYDEVMAVEHRRKLRRLSMGPTASNAGMKALVKALTLEACR